MWPVHSPLRTRSAKPAIRSSTACTSGTTFFPSTTIDGARGCAKRDVEDGPVLGDVDLLARNMASIRARSPDSSASRKEFHRLVGDAVLRVVEEEPDAFGRQPFSARRVVGEERPKVHTTDRLRVRVERLPCLSGGR